MNRMAPAQQKLDQMGTDEACSTGDKYSYGRDSPATRPIKPWTWPDWGVGPRWLGYAPPKPIVPLLPPGNSAKFEGYLSHLRIKISLRRVSDRPGCQFLSMAR